jgi:hypothetical protein
VTNTLEDFHIKLLSPFIYDSSRINPSDVANRDYQNFVVEAILKHKFTPSDSKRTSDLKFLAKWKIILNLGLLSMN